MILAGGAVGHVARYVAAITVPRWRRSRDEACCRRRPIQNILELLQIRSQNKMAKIIAFEQEAREAIRRGRFQVSPSRQSDTWTERS